MKVPARYRPFLLLNLVLGGLFLLLMMIGMWRAGGPTRDVFHEASTGMPQYSYSISQTIYEDLPRDDLPDWLQQQGIPQPTGSAVDDIFPRMWIVANTQVNHEKLQDWLNSTYGPEHWRFSSTSTLRLEFILFNRAFGIKSTSVSYPQFAHTTPVDPFDPPSPFTTLFYGYNSQETAYQDIGPISFSSQFLYYQGPAWPLLLALIYGPALFLFILRRPLARGIFRRHRTVSPPK